MGKDGNGYGPEFFMSIEYKLIRSKRKTASIYITKDASVEVRAPLNMRKSEIDRFLLSKEVWINKHILIRKQKNEQKAGFSISYGDSVLFRGVEYPIRERDGNRAGFDGACFFMPGGLDCDEIKHTVIRIYKSLAKKVLRERVSKYAGMMSLRPAAVKINSAKTRWGSCSGTNSINFSWRLILADDKLIDYVVVHELAHIVEHNHSDRFWAVVERVVPDYKARKSGLRDLQERLSMEDWE